jgi:1-acyl-sn-glycerol-3-phosphate acyltransferase
MRSQSPSRDSSEDRLPAQQGASGDVSLAHEAIKPNAGAASNDESAIETRKPHYEGLLAHVPAPLRVVYETIAWCVGFIAFGLISTLLGTAMGMSRPFLSHHRGHTIGQWLISVWFRAFLGYARMTGTVKLDLRELDAIKHEPGLVLAPNHPSMLDAVFVISRLPRVTCIMKASLWDNIALGGGSRLAGYVRNDSQSNMVRQSVDALQAGHQLLIFPEGTRTVEAPVNPFKGAAGLIAKRAGAPVQTILIETTSPFLGKAWPFFKRPTFPLAYRVRLGKRFDAPAPDASVHEYTGVIEAYFREEMVAQKIHSPFSLPTSSDSSSTS